MLTASGGRNTRTDHILDYISERNARLNNQVILLTYGLGVDTDFTYLKVLATQKNYDRSKGPVQVNIDHLIIIFLFIHKLSATNNKVPNVYIIINYYIITHLKKGHFTSVTSSNVKYVFASYYRYINGTIIGIN